MNSEHDNKTILVLAEVYLPGYLAGGPVRSLANLVAHLGNEFSWKIITADRDFHAKTPYPNVTTDRWIRVGAAEVFYASPRSLSPIRFLSLLRETPHDALYLNSVFDPRFSIFPSLARYVGLMPRRPLLIAPRGEFSAGAYSIKLWKKRPFVGFAKLMGVYSEAVWHASTEHEANDIMRVIGAQRQTIHLARNLGTLPVRANSARKSCRGSALRICFLSRVSRMKNLGYAVRTLAQVTRAVEFTIYGPKEDQQYWSECEALIATLPSHVNVRYVGAVPNEQVCEELSKHDLFFLPTRGENFGHVLVEAWTAGLLVLTSDQTPWRGLEAKGLGWDLPLDSSARFAEVIDDVARWPVETLDAARRRCMTFGTEQIQDESAVLANREMFSSLVALASSTDSSSCDSGSIEHER